MQKKMGTILPIVLTEDIVVTSITSNSNEFTIIFDFVQSNGQYDKPLFHVEVRWLSPGNLLSHLSELHYEVQIFRSNSTSVLGNLFTDEMWLFQLANLADILCYLSDLSKSL
jgi:hypothetical protein